MSGVLDHRTIEVAEHHPLALEFDPPASVDIRGKVRGPVGQLRRPCARAPHGAALDKPTHRA